MLDHHRRADGTRLDHYRRADLAPRLDRRTRRRAAMLDDDAPRRRTLDHQRADPAGLGAQGALVPLTSRADGRQHHACTREQPGLKPHMHVC
ncbi:MAG: hypothetical protein AMXMBFR83_07790 [Phycisphaerae bacterium]